MAGKNLRRILEAARWAPTAHNMQNHGIVVVDDPELRAAVRKLERPVPAVLVRDNYEQLSFSEEELLLEKTGPLTTSFSPALRRPEIDDTDDEVLQSLRTPLPETPVLLVVLYDPGQTAPASEADFLGIVSLGCVMYNIWRAAHALGISLHVISSLGAVEEEAKAILHVPAHLRIAVSCRLGYPLSTADRYLRVRRELVDFTHHNRFGQRF